MTTTPTKPASNVLSADDTAGPRRANARLAPGGHEPAREHDAVPAQNQGAGDAVRWQGLLDQLDPDERCGAWPPATFAGRPVVCTRAPHDAREQHSDAETGWSWYDEKS
jgi:hypothetical protein